MARCEAHQGPVRGLEVNPLQPYLVATGGTNAEVSITLAFIHPVNLMLLGLAMELG